MYERFTDRARKVMKLANQEARRFHHEYIGTEHVLLGLFKEGRGVAAHVLKHFDLDLRTIRVEVEKLIQSGPKLVRMRGLPRTPRAKKAIQYAMEEARNLGHNYVGTEHLLLGLIREHEGVAAHVLTNLGLNFEDVRKEVLQLLADPNRQLDPMDSEPIPHSRSPVLFWIFLAVAAGAVLLLVSLLRTQVGHGVGRSHPAVGKRLPPVALTPLTFDGDPVTTASLEGRVAVINFWGTWCPPCRAELPHIAELGERYAGDDRFKLLAVSCGGGSPSDDQVDDLRQPTAALLDQQQFSLAAYADPAGQARDKLARAGMFEHGYPTTLVVDQGGVVRGLWTGYAPGDERGVEALVAELLAK